MEEKNIGVPPFAFSSLWYIDLLKKKKQGYSNIADVLKWRPSMIFK